MANNSFRIPAIALAIALLALPAATFAQSGAQSGVPTREGNIWDGTDHQPTEAEVLRNEKAAGIAPGSSQKDFDAETVDELYQELMRQQPK